MKQMEFEFMNKPEEDEALNDYYEEDTALVVRDYEIFSAMLAETRAQLDLAFKELLHGEPKDSILRFRESFERMCRKYWDMVLWLSDEAPMLPIPAIGGHPLASELVEGDRYLVEIMGEWVFAEVKRPENCPDRLVLAPVLPKQLTAIWPYALPSIERYVKVAIQKDDWVEDGEVRQDA